VFEADEVDYNYAIYLDGSRTQGLEHQEVGLGRRDAGTSQQEVGDSSAGT